MLKQLLDWIFESTCGARRRRLHACDLPLRHATRNTRLQYEPLETRQLLSVTPAGAEFRVNTYTVGEQRTWFESPQSVAMDDAGNFVVIWTSVGQDGSAEGVYGQRYNAAGTPQGTEFRVNTYTTGLQSFPTVAMDADGDFAVSWTSHQDGGNSDGTYIQRYNAAGVPQGSEFRANTYTTLNQGQSTIAMDSSGNFVVAWISNGQDLSGYGIYAQRFSAAGAAQGSEFRVSSYITGNQVWVSAAMDPDGDFVVTWTSYIQDNGGESVYAQRYNAAGTPQGTEFRVNTYTTSGQRVSTVAMDTSGNFVIVWTSDGQDGSLDGLYAQRYNAAGVQQGSEFRINEYTTGHQRFPRIAMEDDGDFVVSWSSIGQDGSAYGAYARRYNALGVPQGSEFRVNTYTTSDQPFASVAVDADGDFVIVWTSAGQDGNGRGIFAQRFDASSVTTITDLRVAGDTSQIDEGERLVQTVGSLSVTFSQAMSAASVQTPANWVLTKDGGDISNQITSIVYNAGNQTAALTLTTPLANGKYVLTAKGSLVDSDGVQLDGDANNVAGGDFVRSFRIVASVAVGSEFRINTYTTGTQRTQIESRRMAAAPNGDFVVTWESNGQDGDSDGVYAQRFNADGVALGSEFRVNTYTTNNQSRSTVAIDADGDFVITWQSYLQDGSFNGVYAQRYNAAGTPQGSEFRVNTINAGNQGLPSIGMDANGNFAIAWVSNGPDGSGYGVYAQRYNAAGTPQGSEFRVNDYTTGNQARSSMAMSANGDFVVVWASTGRDGSGEGIYARRYSAAGAPQGSDFQVNTYTTSEQLYSMVAMDDSGNFVVTWSSSGQDGNGYGVYAQRFNALGSPQGSEFRVNTYTTLAQRYSSVAMDSDGDFVITWTSLAQDASTYAVMAQRYNPAGVPQGSEFRVNTYTTMAQRWSSVSMDADGDFIVIWSSQNQDNSGEGVYGQRYAIPNSIPTTTGLPPVNVLENAPNTVIALTSYFDDVESGAAGLTYTVRSNSNAGLFTSVGIAGSQLTLDYATYVFGTSSIVIRATDPAGGFVESTLAVTVNPGAFRVIDFTPTATGFTASFNHALDTSVLNLYDQGDLLGAADVVLSGATAGAVRGSVVVDPTLKKITFIKSGDVLAPDTYSFQLKSAAGAFRDSNGALLDGDANDVAGGDYSGNFTIAQPAANAVTLSIPDVVRGRGQTVNFPADSGSGLPVTISTGQGVSGVDFTLSYDPSLLSINAVDLGPDVNGSLTSNSPEPGVLVVTISSATQLSASAGPLKLLNLTASIPSNATYGASQLLDLKAIHVYDSNAVLTELPSLDNDGLQLAAYFGDASGSQSYNSPDATLTQRIIVGFNTGLLAYPLVDPRLVVDITGNGFLQSNDVTLIQRAIVGAPVSQIPALPIFFRAPLSLAVDSLAVDSLAADPSDAASADDGVSAPAREFVALSSDIAPDDADQERTDDETEPLLSDADASQISRGLSLSASNSAREVVQHAFSSSGPANGSHAADLLQAILPSRGGEASSVERWPSFASLDAALDDLRGRLATSKSIPPQAAKWAQLVDAIFDARDWT